MESILVAMTVSLKVDNLEKLMVDGKGLKLADRMAGSWGVEKALKKVV